MRLNIQKYITIGCISILSTSSYGQLLFGNQRPPQQESRSGLQKLFQASQIVSSMYVDKVDESKMVVDAIEGMISKLDPHSEYLTPEEVKEMNEPLQGGFDGIGISFQVIKDTLLVTQVISGGPSSKVGLRDGDQIVRVGSEVIAGVKMKNTDIMKRLRGPKGTVAEIEIKRRGIKELLSFRVVRDKIPMYSVESWYMAAPKVGYLRIERFAQDTYNEMMRALADLRKQGMVDLILDLQGNGGGYMNSAVDIANEFLQKDQLIVYTEGNRAPRQDDKAKGNGTFSKGRLIIMIDEYSASSSEILAGAIQDWDRGFIIGRRSYGKGLVQRPFPLPDNSMLKLTIARYYTPSGRCIQKPYGKGSEEYAKDILNRWKHGEFSHADSIQFPDSLKQKTLIKGRIVYGGGGIMPDLFIPLDTTRYTTYYRAIIGKGIFSEVVTDYSITEKEQLAKTYKNLTDFIGKYKVPETLLQKIVDRASQDKIEYKADEYEKSKNLIALQIKAFVGRDLFTNGAYLQVMNQDNDTYLRALELLKTPKQYEKWME